jgi:lysophospholipase L1-like esterase
VYCGARITTNDEGWRDVNYELKKGTETIRIIGLGDSIMFGQGIPDGDDFTVQLEAQLSHAFGAKRWEIINTAVPGYNTAMQVATLKAKGLKYRPDIVLIMFIGNDIELPNFIGVKEDYLSLQKSFLIELLVARYRKRQNIQRNILIEGGLADGGKWYENDPDKVPEEYRHMVGIQGYRKAMAELCGLSKEYGFEIIVCSDAPVPDSIKIICDEMGLEIVNAYAGILDYMREQGIAERGGPPLTVSKEDMHPSSLAHKIIAEYYFQYFSKHIAKKYL